jgi:hypothetical protein
MCILKNKVIIGWKKTISIPPPSPKEIETSIVSLEYKHIFYCVESKED